MSRRLRRARRAKAARQALYVRNAGTIVAPNAAPQAAPQSDWLRNLDITVRAIPLTAASVNESNRTAVAMLSTEAPVQVWDWDRGIIDEVLVARGAVIPDQVPLLDSHNRWTITAQHGSVRNMAPTSGGVSGTLHFSDADEPSRAAFKKVQEGHVRDVSVGYKPLEATDIAPGKSAEVDGKRYTAKDRWLRITTKWSMREVSMTPIGADEFAKIRDAAQAQGRGAGVKPASQAKKSQRLQRLIDRRNENKTSSSGGAGNNSEGNWGMNEQLRAYLESIGLRAEASDQEAWAFYGQLEGVAKIAADAVRSAVGGDEAGANGVEGEGETAPASPARSRRSNSRSAPNSQRFAPQGAAPGAPAGEGQDAPIDAEAVRSAAITAERNRQAGIRALAGDTTPPELLQAALNGVPAVTADAESGRAAAPAQLPMTVDQFARALLNHERGNRNPPANQAPAGHTGNPARGERVAAIAASIFLRSVSAVGSQARDYTRIPTRGILDPDARKRAQERIANQSDAYRQMSLLDICEESLRIEGREVNRYDREGMIRSAMSTATLSQIFTDSVHAQVVADFMEYPDSTDWCEVGEVENFKVNTDITRSKNGNTMNRLARGGEAEHITFSDEGETFKAVRFAEQVVIDEQDIIDDMFGILTEQPGEMAADAARIVPDWVYYVLLSNPALVADTTAIFHTNHANNATNALSLANLATGILTMMKQTRNNVKLDVRPQYLMVPPDLHFTAKELLNSTQLITGSDTVRGNANVLQGENLQLRTDPRLGVAGTNNPLTKVAQAGTATCWFLAANRRTIKKVYRRGTGRRPSVRSFVLDRGSYGMGWDINLDVGVFARDYRGLYRGNDTGL